MRTLFTALVVLSLFSLEAQATLCSRTFTFADGAILTASQLNTEFNTLVNCTNSIDESNVLPNANFDPLVINATIAGDGIGRSGTTGALNVNVDGVGIETSADTLQLKDDGVVTSKILDANVTQAKLAIGATGKYNVLSKTSNYSASLGDFIKCDATGGNFTITLPTAVGFSGQSIVLKKINASNSVNVAFTLGQTADGSASYALKTIYESVTFTSDGANWMVN